MHFCLLCEPFVSALNSHQSLLCSAGHVAVQHKQLAAGMVTGSNWRFSNLRRAVPACAKKKRQRELLLAAAVPGRPKVERDQYRKKNVRNGVRISEG